MILTPLQKQIIEFVKESEEIEKNENSNNKRQYCKNCGFELKTVVRQTRKGDEGMTVFTICNTCFKTYKT
uniref:TFIIS-type domain-containing protein n=1 Tax=viral metagenome TaxID=1070528 RepID=A0A6C0JBX6_9ZZZZ